VTGCKSIQKSRELSTTPKQKNFDGQRTRLGRIQSQLARHHGTIRDTAVRALRFGPFDGTTEFSQPHCSGTSGPASLADDLAASAGRSSPSSSRLTFSSSADCCGIGMSTSEAHSRVKTFQLNHNGGHGSSSSSELPMFRAATPSNPIR